MELSKLLNVHPTRKLLLQFLRPSEIVNLFTATAQVLTPIEKHRYLTLEREILKTTNGIDEFISQGGTLLFVGDDVRSLLSTFTRYHKHEYIQKIYYSIWVLCISPLQRGKKSVSKGYGTITPVLRPAGGVWFKYEREKFNYENLTSHSKSSFFPKPHCQLLESVPGSRSYDITQFNNWWYTTADMVESNIKLFSNAGQYRYVEDMSMCLYSPIVSIEYNNGSHQGHQILRSRKIPHVDIKQRPNIIKYARKHKSTIHDHVPITINIIRTLDYNSFDYQQSVIRFI